jgi:hypothetical protein
VLEKYEKSKSRSRFMQQLKTKLMAPSVINECEKINLRIKDMITLLQAEMDLRKSSIETPALNSQLQGIVEKNSTNQEWSSLFQKDIVPTLEFISQLKINYQAVFKGQDEATKKRVVDEIAKYLQENGNIFVNDFEDLTRYVNFEEILQGLIRHPNYLTLIKECRVVVDSLFQALNPCFDHIDPWNFWCVLEMFEESALMNCPEKMETLKNELNLLCELFTLILKDPPRKSKRWILGQTRLSHRFDCALVKIYAILASSKKIISETTFYAEIQKQQDSNVGLYDMELQNLWLNESIKGV